MSSQAAYPVRTLREHATALEAALSMCMGEPDKRAVHKLRTETRRIEAQIALLKLVRGLPSFRPAAARLLRQSRKLRRAAGEVRDFDVRHKLIKEEAEKVTRDADDRAAVQKRFDELTVICDQRRGELAVELMSVLKKRQGKVAAALENLKDALKHADGRRLSGTEMRALVDRAFRSTRELRLRAPDDDQLHTIRKAAKRARYQLESAPGSSVARRAAQGYEALQDSGGQWHDWLELAKLSDGHFGTHHRVTMAFTAERDRYRRAYESLLEQTRTAIRKAATQKTGGARKVVSRGRNRKTAAVPAA